eukprot:SAG11_NODE_149_length_14661_cov_10.031658_5_plen_84_part_00
MLPSPVQDETFSMAPITEQAAVAPATRVDRQFHPKIFKFNFTCNKQFRLSAMTSQAQDHPQYFENIYNRISEEYVILVKPVYI